MKGRGTLSEKRVAPLATTSESSLSPTWRKAFYFNSYDAISRKAQAFSVKLQAYANLLRVTQWDCFYINMYKLVS